MRDGEGVRSPQRVAGHRPGAGGGAGPSPAARWGLGGKLI